MARADRQERSGQDRAHRRRLHRRHDRPLRARRASPPVRRIPHDVMNLFRDFHGRIAAEVEALAAEGAWAPGRDSPRISVEPPRDPAHGDVSANAAMVLAKAAGMKPRDFAEKLRPRLARLEHVVSAEIAGPGFINLKLTDDFWQARLGDILRAGPTYGDSKLGRGRKVNVEYVSANPTGPLHVGHGRGAVIGDVLAALLEKSGFNVTREYYVNDSGAQIDALARSAHLRYREALGETIGAIPEGLYPGDYVDRPLKKSDGSWTYFAADIAYHNDKVQRGFHELIDVWGADHGGYVKRMQAAVKALSEGSAALDVKLCQLVNLLDKGEPVKMSKRAGNFVTLREVVDQVGKDVFRFVMLTRRNDQALDFDFAKVVEQSK